MSNKREIDLKWFVFKIVVLAIMIQAIIEEALKLEGVARFSPQFVTMLNACILLMFAVPLQFFVLRPLENRLHSTIEKLKKAQLDAEIASRAKSEFLANMSHEIPDSLERGDRYAGVAGNHEAWIYDINRYTTIAKSSADALLGIINDILDFSKIEAGKLELERVPFNLHQMMEEIAEMFGHRATAKNVELCCHILPGVPTNIVGDPERLRQIVVNLTSNALKFTEQGEVAIRVAPEVNEQGKPELRFSVRDTGIGIPIDRKNRLFSKFSQVDASTTRKFGGTGLGLAICKQLTELMGGKIGVDSEIGKGSTFWIVIPVESVAQNEQERRDATQRMTGLNVLVVDDIQTNLDILKDLLSGWGMNVTTARDAKLSLEMMRFAAATGNPLSARNFGLPDAGNGRPAIGDGNSGRKVDRRDAFDHAVVERSIVGTLGVGEVRAELLLDQADSAIAFVRSGGDSLGNSIRGIHEFIDRYGRGNARSRGLRCSHLGLRR